MTTTQYTTMRDIRKAIEPIVDAAISAKDAEIKKLQAENKYLAYTITSLREVAPAHWFSGDMETYVKAKVGEFESMKAKIAELEDKLADAKIECDSLREELDRSYDRL